MLISVHLPKTAGTSFRRILEAHFGERLRPDYDDRPLNRSRWQRRAAASSACARLLLSQTQLRGADCIHGHFLPLKYRALRGPPSPRFVTWLRDPIERLASHYHYWRTSYEPETAGVLHRRVVEEDWTMERFCLGEELRNVYCEFLWGFAPTKFAFVGISEFFEEDLREFGTRILGVDSLPMADENRGQLRDAGKADERYIDNGPFRQRLERFHAEDVALYRQALSRREARLRYA